MARRKDTPSLTWERVWKGIREGSLEVKRVPGTRMLLVIKGRIRLTWKQRGKKRHARVRLNKTYLNPRWIPLPANYPISVSKLRKLRREKLYTLGIVRLSEDDFRLLIYQQLDDLSALQRQLAEHTQPKYLRETSRLWKMLEKASSQEPLKAVEQTALTGVVLDRIEKIDAISTHLAGREKAVESRLDRLNKVQSHVRGALEILLDFVPVSGETKINGTSKGLGNSLGLHYKTLEHLLENKPFAHYARWARYHIKRAQECLTENNFKGTYRHIEKAIEHL